MLLGDSWEFLGSSWEFLGSSWVLLSLPFPLQAPWAGSGPIWAIARFCFCNCPPGQAASWAKSSFSAPSRVPTPTLASIFHVSQFWSFCFSFLLLFLEHYVSPVKRLLLALRACFVWFSWCVSLRKSSSETMFSVDGSSSRSTEIGINHCFFMTKW